jgi:regulator of nucleoside diphosphate kinase
MQAVTVFRRPDFRPKDQAVVASRMLFAVKARRKAGRASDGFDGPMTTMLAQLENGRLEIGLGRSIDQRSKDMQGDRIAEMRPPIAIDAAHFARLSALSSLTSGPMTEVCEYLREELDRADVLPAEKLRSDIVSLGSRVEFRDEHTGKSREIILVYPLDADIARRRVSVLTPVGAALLGLSVNQTISFRTRTGDRRELTVLRVDRAG